MGLMMRKLNLYMMMDMKNTLIKSHLRVLLIILKEDILKPIVIGKEKKLHNINLILNAKDVMAID